MTNQNSNYRKGNGTGFIIFIIFLLGITLPFHYVPSHLKVFPKNNFTFSHTIVTQEDIDYLVERYNDASFFEKQAIKNEAFFRKLIEEGIIFETDDK